MNRKRLLLCTLGVFFLGLIGITGCSSEDPNPLEPPTEVPSPEPEPNPNPNPKPEPNPNPEPEPTPIQKRLKTFYYEMANGSGTTFTFTYDEQGRVKTIDNTMGTKWEFTYNQEEITTQSATLLLNDNSRPTITLKVKEGQITQSTLYVGQIEKYVTYNWNYDAKGYLTSIVKQSETDDSPSYNFTMEQTYIDHKLTAFNFNKGMITGKLEFGTDPQKMDFTAIEPIYLFYMNNFIFEKEDFFIAKLLNLAGKSSSCIPLKMTICNKPISAESETCHTHSIKTSVDNEAWIFEKEKPMDEYDTAKVVLTAETY